MDFKLSSHYQFNLICLYQSKEIIILSVSSLTGYKTQSNFSVFIIGEIMSLSIKIQCYT
jgi:hypothetical protein